MEVNILNKIQVIVGYLVILSIFEIFLYSLSNILILCAFSIFMIFIKIIPHPKSSLNPFAFGVRFRKKH